MINVLTPQSYHAARAPKLERRALGHAGATRDARGSARTRYPRGRDGRISSMNNPAPAIALLVEDGFEDQQLTGIIEGFAMAQVELVAIGPVAARTYTGRDGVAAVTSEIAPGTARGRTFAAVVIPGGY